MVCTCNGLSNYPSFIPTIESRGYNTIQLPASLLAILDSIIMRYHYVLLFPSISIQSNSFQGIDRASVLGTRVMGAESCSPGSSRYVLVLCCRQALTRLEGDIVVGPGEQMRERRANWVR